MSLRDAAKRWTGSDGAALAARVLERLVSGESLDELPLGRHDGRVDLRGFVVPSPKVVGKAHLGDGRRPPAVSIARLSEIVTLRAVSLSNLDLSGARLEHLRFFDASIRGCLFEKAKCRDWRGWNLSVSDCSFARADLRDSVLATQYEGRTNRWSAIDFSGADLRGIVCAGGSFTDCDFSEARLDKVTFGSCALVRCRFRGLLDEVTFAAYSKVGTDTPEAGRLEDVDLSGAVLRWVEFSGLSLARVTLPPEGDAHVIVRNYPHVVRAALERLARVGDQTSEETRTLRSRLQVAADRLERFAHDRDIGIWHVDELGETAEEQGFARDLLHAVEREVGARSAN